MATNTLHALTPDALVERLAASGLRGRGGGWFEAARKWRAVRVEGGEPFVVANGAEGEPGSYKDRFVMLRRPQDVVAGLALAARAVGAREAVVFLKGSFDRPAKALSGAIAAASLDGLSVEVRRGDDGYVTGEETALLEALEGRKPWPRPKPPLPAAVGFRGRPTLVQNVETLARVPAALGDPEAYRRGARRPSSRSGATCVGRASTRCPSGTPLRRVIDEHAGGATEAVGLVFPGGPAGMPLRCVRPRRAPRPRVAPREGHGARHRGRSWSSATRPARSRWRPRSPASSSARTAPSARPARSAPRASPASCARSSRAARARATCATSPTWPASCPATATARTAAPPPPSPPGWRAASRTRWKRTSAAAGARGPSAGTRTPSPPARRSAPRSRRPSRSSCDEIPHEERPDRPDPGDDRLVPDRPRDRPPVGPADPERAAGLRRPRPPPPQGRARGHGAGHALVGGDRRHRRDRGVRVVARAPRAGSS